jgi:hypothetical protein
MSAEHPSVWLTRWLERHALKLEHVAASIAALEDGSDQAYGIAYLSLEMFILVGPSTPTMKLGELAEQLDRVFARPAGFFAQMEQRWHDGGCSQEGRPS